MYGQKDRLVGGTAPPPCLTQPDRSAQSVQTLPKLRTARRPQTGSPPPSRGRHRESNLKENLRIQNRRKTESASPQAAPSLRSIAEAMRIRQVTMLDAAIAIQFRRSARSLRRRLHRCAQDRFANCNPAKAGALSELFRARLNPLRERTAGQKPRFLMISKRPKASNLPIR